MGQLCLFSAAANHPKFFKKAQIPQKNEENPFKCLACELQVKTGTLGVILCSYVWSLRYFPCVRHVS